jgi:hypothetical protein
MTAMERRVRSRDHWRNVDLTSKKTRSKNFNKTTTNAGRTTTNVNGAMEKPKHWSCRRDKSYKTTDKSSSKVRRTTETSSQIVTKAIKDIKEADKDF